MSTKDLCILVVDDDKNIRRTLQTALQSAGYMTEGAATGREAQLFVESRSFDAMILDIRLPDTTGLEVYQQMRAAGIDTPTLFMSGHATLSEAVQAVRMGAYDFIEKPFSPEKIVVTLERALERQSLQMKVRELSARQDTGLFVSESPTVKKVFGIVEKVAPTTATVLIQGESGTGKEIIARAIHDSSSRREGPFIKINCAALPDSLIESELFGHEKGAFTGAHQSKRGFFELAHRGTLFLDEIGDMSPAAQAKVLRAIQSQEIQRVGSEKFIKTDARIVVATHQDLQASVRSGKFREDLLFRLSVVNMTLPPLRERIGDIPLFISHFLKSLSQRHGLPIKQISDETVAALAQYSWPGNIRELENFMERLLILSGDTISVEDLPEFIFATKSTPLSTSPVASGQTPTLRVWRESCERSYIIEILKKSSGNVSASARTLGIERTFLHKKIHQLSITRVDYT